MRLKDVLLAFERHVLVAGGVDMMNLFDSLIISKDLWEYLGKVTEILYMCDCGS